MPGGTDRSVGPVYASTCLPAGRIRDGEVIEERFVRPFAGPLSHPAIRPVGWRSEGGGRAGETQVIESLIY